MDKMARAEKIIQEYRESRETLRKIIKEYEDQEYRLFSIMIHQIKELDQDDNSHTFRREFAQSLD